MSTIGGVGSNPAMAELLQAQNEQMAQLLQTMTSGNIELSEKLVRLNVETQLQASEQQTISQVLDMYI
jgi:hypothetical protein